LLRLNRALAKQEEHERKYKRETFCCCLVFKIKVGDQKQASGLAVFKIKVG